MTFVIPDSLAPEVYPLAWLLGEWEGAGEVSYPDIPRSEFTQRISFTHDGGPYLTYQSVITLVGGADAPGQVWSSESGYWRVSPSTPPSMSLHEHQHPIETVLADAAGLVSVYVGAVGNGRIDLATDLMARTHSASDVAGATRMYGYVAGELMWAWDLAAFGHDLQSYAAARLTKVNASSVQEDS